MRLITESCSQIVKSFSDKNQLHTQPLLTIQGGQIEKIIYGKPLDVLHTTKFIESWQKQNFVEKLIMLVKTPDIFTDRYKKFGVKCLITTDIRRSLKLISSGVW